MTTINPALAGSALVGGIAALGAILTLVSATQAETGWRVRATPTKAVMAYFDPSNELVRFYVGGKEVAILSGSAVLESPPAGR